MEVRVMGQPEPGLTVPAERCLASVLLQSFSMLALCLATADPSWLLVQLQGGGFHVYGVAYALHERGNLTDPESQQLLQNEGHNLLLVMAVCCYLSLLFCFTAFLIDFVDNRKFKLMGVKLSALLHLATALSIAAAVGECAYLFIFLRRERDTQSKTKINSIRFGESMFFAIFACVMSLIAALVSFCCRRTYRRAPRAHRSRVRTEDTAPLLQEPTETSIVEYG